MNVLVTGGAGFIGSNLVKRLSKLDHNITVYDNLSTGKKEHISDLLERDGFCFIHADLTDKEKLGAAMRGQDFVYHLAANADIRYGTDNPTYDLEQNVLCTHNVLEAMRKNGVKKIAFSSTSTTFGETDVIPTPENYGPALPTSLYGASKLSCEGFISAYCSLFDIQAWIFRFANVIGPNVTHGILADLAKKLKYSDELDVLGDGEQFKSYIHVEDCIDGMLFAIEHSKGCVNLFNLGSEDQIKIKRIAQIVVDELSPGTKIRYTGGTQGWKGDIPVMKLDITKIKNLGWKPRFNSEQAVIESVKSMKGS
ncbi:MAG: NAD-dependent epimerase/dehydratase family protein [Candidatus Aenigmatarchaeota archaeon]